MAGLFDLITSLSGAPNPWMQLAAALGQARRNREATRDPCLAN
jgi:hypothetical protein